MDIERQNNTNKLSYDGIKEQIKERVKHPTVSGTLIVFFILNLIMLIVGFVHLHDCPVKKLIPIYLVVAGAVGIVSKLLPFINRKLELAAINYVIYVLYAFEFVWMFLGAYWVYSIYTPNFNFPSLNYCNKTAYYFAFWLLTINLVLLGVSAILVCCAAICVGVLNRKK